MDEQVFLHAARNGDLATVRQGLDSGFGANHKDKRGMTILMWSSWDRDQEDVCKFLLECGADPKFRQESSGWNSMTFAAVNNLPKCLRLYLDAGVEIEEAAGDWKMLSFAVQYRSHDTVRMLLEHGAHVDVRDDSGRTPLMRAARNGDRILVPLLLANGASAQTTDNQGRTPLHYAAERANVENVEAILKAGAKPHIVAGDKTALDLAREKKRTRVAALLESIGPQ